ncbi:MAG: redoxin family protein [bacterium]
MITRVGKLALIALGSLIGYMAADAAVAAEVGDPAAALQISEWVKGKPVNLAAGKGKQVFVIEFWATWCPPCKESIPHLTRLQKKYKDVIFIGISGENAGDVKSFVAKMGDTMDYVVAIDNKDQTSDAYMGAYGVSGIPHAFVVDRSGAVVWHGHPMDDIDKVLDDVLAGKYDATRSKRRAEGIKMIERFVTAVGDGSDDAVTDKLGEEIEALDKELGGLMDGRRFQAAEVKKAVKFQQAMTSYQQALFSQADAAEIKKYERAASDLAPKGVDFKAIQQELRAQLLTQQYIMAVSRSGDESKAAELGSELGKLPTKNPQVLNAIAWTLLTDERIVKRDLLLALKIAKAALDASDGKNTAILDTYARALFDNGRTGEAVKFQKNAIESATGEFEGIRPDLEETLKKYVSAAAKAKAGAEK